MAKPEQLASGTVVWVPCLGQYGVVWKALGAGCFLVRPGRKVGPVTTGSSLVSTLGMTTGSRPDLSAS